MVNSSGSCPENRCSIQRPAIDFGFTLKEKVLFNTWKKTKFTRHSLCPDFVLRQKTKFFSRQKFFSGMYLCFLPT